MRVERCKLGIDIHIPILWIGKAVESCAIACELVFVEDFQGVLSYYQVLKEDFPVGKFRLRFLPIVNETKKFCRHAVNPYRLRWDFGNVKFNLDASPIGLTIRLDDKL
jgi:hypothetical protein